MSRRQRSPVALTILAIALAVAAFLLDAWANGQIRSQHANPSTEVECK